MLTTVRNYLNKFVGMPPLSPPLPQPTKRLPNPISTEAPLLAESLKNINLKPVQAPKVSNVAEPIVGRVLNTEEAMNKTVYKMWNLSHEITDRGCGGLKHENNTQISIIGAVINELNSSDEKRFYEILKQNGNFSVLSYTNNSDKKIKKFRESVVQFYKFANKIKEIPNAVDFSKLRLDAIYFLLKSGILDSETRNKIAEEGKNRILNEKEAGLWMNCSIRIIYENLKTCSDKDYAIMLSKIFPGTSFYPTDSFTIMKEMFDVVSEKYKALLFQTDSWACIPTEARFPANYTGSQSPSDSYFYIECKKAFAELGRIYYRTGRNSEWNGDPKTANIDTFFKVVELATQKEKEAKEDLSKGIIFNSR